MSIDANTASIDQCRDWIAENVLGWERNGRSESYEWTRDTPDGPYEYDGKFIEDHPAGPASTDAAIAAMPKEWEWVKGHDALYGYKRGVHVPVHVKPTGDFKLDIWRLCLAMHIAERGGK